MAHTPGNALTAELGYRFAGRRAGAFWSPFLAAEAGDGGQALRFGLKFVSGRELDASVEFGRMYQAPGVAPEDTVLLRGAFSF